MRKSAVFLLALLAIPLSAEAGTLARFEGDSNERTAMFEPGGPWMLYWYTQSEDTLPKTFELRLHDADSGEYLGTVIQQRIIANGKKLFEDAGRYQLDVVALNLDWTLVVSEIADDKAAQLIRESKGQPTLEDSAARYANQVSESSFETWRPEGWVMAVGFSAGFTVLALYLLPRLKGMFVGFQWAKRLHGFGG